MMGMGGGGMQGMGGGMPPWMQQTRVPSPYMNMGQMPQRPQGFAGFGGFGGFGGGQSPFGMQPNMGMGMRPPGGPMPNMQQGGGMQPGMQQFRGNVGQAQPWQGQSFGNNFSQAQPNQGQGQAYGQGGMNPQMMASMMGGGMRR